MHILIMMTGLDVAGGAQLEIEQFIKLIKSDVEDKTDADFKPDNTIEDDKKIDEARKIQIWKLINMQE